MAKKKVTKTWPYGKTTPAGIPVGHTTGYLTFNDTMFNKHFGTDDAALNGGGELTSSGGEAGGGDCSGGDCGGMAESLVTEAKREVRRYYLKPQGIWCSNKAEVLKALIDVGTNDCIIYTLKNIADNDDVHKLTDHDIIYYYEDGILYDKNKVRVMDYDLVIKHEENRKKLSPNASDREFINAYEDRITDQSIIEEVDNMVDETKDLTESVEEKYNKIQLKDALVDGQTICIGRDYEDADVLVVDGEQYSHTEFVIACFGEHYSLESWLVSHHGGEEQGDVYIEFDDFDNLWNYITKDSRIAALEDSVISLEECCVSEPEEARPVQTDEDFKIDFIDEEESAPSYADDLPIEELQDEAFDLIFEARNVYGEPLTEATKEGTCCICGEKFEGTGNNAEPYKKGTCCDACNSKFVLPMCMSEYNNEYNLDKEVEDKDFDEALATGVFDLDKLNEQVEVEAEDEPEVVVPEDISLDEDFNELTDEDLTDETIED